ncbi:MAG: branched-chain amino acid aminotransferase [Candidatus Heimdallarchaeaceae archaeon]
MSEFMDIQIQLRPEEKKKEKPQESDLTFGKSFTDHMFLMKYSNEKWSSPQIIPYQKLCLDPASLVFHYGQEIFEGMKAFRHPNGSIYLFRPYENAERFNRSAERMCMPKINKDLFVKAIVELIRLDKDWVPQSEGTSLYIRPTMIATEIALGVHPSSEYYFYIILSPVGSYIKKGFNPIKIFVSTKQARVALGGTGEAKTGGNYAATLQASLQASAQGYDQVLWLDAKERKYIEEASAMNIMFVIDGQIYTPPLDGTILRGITRKSVIELATILGYQVHEEVLDIHTILNLIESERCTEIFCVGTAASITPVGEISFEGRSYTVNNNKVGEITKKLYNELIGIQRGTKHDRFNWMYKVV